MGPALGRLAGTHACVSSVHRAGGDAGFRRLCFRAPISSRPGIDPSAGGFAAQFRERATLAKPPGATRKAGFFGSVSGGGRAADDPYATYRHVVFRDTNTS